MKALLLAFALLVSPLCAQGWNKTDESSKHDLVDDINSASTVVIALFTAFTFWASWGRQEPTAIQNERGSLSPHLPSILPSDSFLVQTRETLRIIWSVSINKTCFLVP
jgi:hypothetical protein